MTRIIITSGEPAGIGPDLCIAIAQRDWPCELVFAVDGGHRDGSAQRGDRKGYRHLAVEIVAVA